MIAKLCMAFCPIWSPPPHSYVCIVMVCIAQMVFTHEPNWSIAPFYCTVDAIDICVSSSLIILLATFFKLLLNTQYYSFPYSYYSVSLFCKLRILPYITTLLTGVLVFGASLVTVFLVDKVQLVLYNIIII